jgi:hypothetical protein
MVISTYYAVQKSTEISRFLGFRVVKTCRNLESNFLMYARTARYGGASCGILEWLAGIHPCARGHCSSAFEGDR